MAKKKNDVAENGVTSATVIGVAVDGFASVKVQLSTGQKLVLVASGSGIGNFTENRDMFVDALTRTLAGPSPTPAAVPKAE